MGTVQDEEAIGYDIPQDIWANGRRRHKYIIMLAYYSDKSIAG